MKTLEKAQNIVYRHNELKNEALQVIVKLVTEEPITLSKKDSDYDECDFCEVYDGNRVQILEVMKDKPESKTSTGIKLHIYNESEQTNCWIPIEQTNTDYISLMLSIVCELEYQLAVSENN